MADFDGPAGDNQAMKQTLQSWNSELLMQVEVPVSVSLGRAQMRLKELLALTHGSIVELHGYVGDEVEIRIDKCVIAHGEVVAVDGNYGVRITRMAADPNSVQTPAPEGAPLEGTGAVQSN